MALLRRNGVLVRLGAALSSAITTCIEKCCRKWYCHTDYTCDQEEFGYISEHTTKDDCLRQCGDKVEHYCHTDLTCDTDPTDALASYPSRQACDEACDKWYCVYVSNDFSKGSICQKGPPEDPGRIRSGPYNTKEECDPKCENLYYCVHDPDLDPDDPDSYFCVVDPTGYLVISGPESQQLCEDTCNVNRKSIWCVDNKRCVISYSGPPLECSFGAFCEEHDTMQDCLADCLKERWYCVAPGEPCQQLDSPPTPDATAYSTQAECDAECGKYYCCWVSNDRSKGSTCQQGPCEPGFERSGPHDSDKECVDACSLIYCWSYRLGTEGPTVKVCQEDEPTPCGDRKCGEGKFCTYQPPDCGEGACCVFGEFDTLEEAHAATDGFPYDALDKAACDAWLSSHPNPPCAGTQEGYTEITKVSGPYGPLADCEAQCLKPRYKYYCAPDGSCSPCCTEGNCAAGDTPCPENVTLFDTQAACDICAYSCTCISAPLSFMSVRFAADGDQLCLRWSVLWDAPPACAGAYFMEFEFLDADGNMLGGIGGGSAFLGVSDHEQCGPLASTCAGFAQNFDRIRGRVLDRDGNCPSPWVEARLSPDSPPLGDLCPPPPDGYVCQGPFSGIWECAPCNDCAGNPETYATLEECEAACQPPDKDCCVECDSGVNPESCDGCPEGYDCHDIGGAFFCIASTPVECGFAENGDWLQDTLDALKACEDKGGTGTATQAPCREPPKQECCLVCEIPGPPPEQCPDGFFFASNGLCQKYFPTDCSDEQIAEAARQCSAAGGAAVGPPEGPCPEPPPTTSCTPASCPPDKYCTFHHPDCGPGECCPTGVWDTLAEAQGVASAYPYDAFSKQACEQWYQEHYPGPCGENECADGKSVWEWQMASPGVSRWTLVWETCTISGCDPYNPPTDSGTFFGERQEMPCLPRGRNPLP